MSKIPSDEEFAQAKSHMRKLDRNMDQIDKNIRAFFKKIIPNQSHDFYILAEEEFSFRAYFFYNKNEDIKIFENRGSSQKLRCFVYEELERQGRGGKDDVKVAFEFDSDENVKSVFGGDYFLRLR